jgi:hypothetical protein
MPRAEAGGADETRTSDPSRDRKVQAVDPSKSFLEIQRLGLPHLTHRLVTLPLAVAEIGGGNCHEKSASTDLVVAEMAAPLSASIRPKFDLEFDRLITTLG